MSQLPINYKIIFMGNTGVGKTSIIRRKKDNVFQLIVDPTVGTGRTTIEVTVEGVSIHIMGTAALRASLPIICEFDTLRNR
ncbi:hypothetical protein TVAG_144870 [Trichomonas vaginalis G3]|uniref:Uncharacterized protein n=1 Tax=Trichomonas vaginalis (strain ATCC PRA-98 / G3) TaxID=412133 RepID=A2GP38_TRIV3|nr:hypothetical protein TVAG_144870 [Trichomonas vaginalis G3]|eukprot:XP_001294007.1 hypothetical protein [Trichomonas vaginalis G3]